ncbi:2-oxoglutarate dehydrogenase, E2 component, dihydrolipoamide succinyltransferase [Nocardioides daeguensis]|uniref:Dihydrolipoamide acetyltransferase component of pyruvate dehydrogenase complex n=1 Tax=Nocardioides daeguensis TaxID=908359 RepID=A0ABP6VYQ3_9ACTN|nr:2-oxoglutarate dehydrogenase, E2 component, dihydrolipoamide succinyltransferase [Nocardioides daeguensis]MBV6726950.1 2-oxoglutarate dehydrogenase, E2 component, dihydrolipoamide succinyltransferase [Nocardioides daeguensis]MCR1772949.1 2-oxoglutarate dehydrogenase, E2 component, dihydrolipoamide succinyltransferase [Nocardioides daeguensis]
MATEVTLPALGESVTEGTVTRWLKQVGDQIAIDEPLLEVSTDKVDTEIPSPVAGTLVEIRANEDDTVEVGAVLAVVGEAGEAPAAAPAAAAPADETPIAAPAEPAPAAAAPSAPAPVEEAPTPAPAAPAASGGAADGTAVTLPALGESVTEGTVTRWLKQVGDAVAVDEPLLEVSTDKVDTEIPSPVAGTLLEIKAAEDETVEVGAELAIIGSGAPAAAAPAPAAPAPAAEAPAPAAPAVPAAAAPAPAAPAAPAPAPAAPAPAAPAPAAPAPAAPAPAAPAPAAPAHTTDATEGPGYVTPLVRKLAAQHGVDLGQVTGSGVGGRIRKQDVLDAAASKAPAVATPAPAAAPAAAAPTPSPLRGQTVKVSRLRKIIAERMVESLHVSAQLTQVVEIDVTNIARLRESVKAEFLAREGVKLTYLPFFTKAAIDTLKHHPVLNANLDLEKGEITYYDRENVAFAVDTDKGLLTPVVKDAGDLSVSGLAKKIADVAERTRTNKIGPDELSGGTFTITNLGSFGALWDTPIINQPQVAVLGPGAVVKRPVVIDDEDLGETIAVRHMVYFALTYDHRVVDGADAGRFLRDLKKRLESGQFEV